MLASEEQLWAEVSTISKLWGPLMEQKRFEEADALISNELAPVLTRTRWWASYRGQVKGQIRQVAQTKDAVAIVVQIDGGVHSV